MARKFGKLCIDCGLHKPELDAEWRRKRCFECRKEYLLAHHRAWAKANRVHCNNYIRAYNRKDPTKNRRRVTKWKKKNPDRVNRQSRLGYQRHRQARLQQTRQRRSSMQPETREYFLDLERKRKRANPEQRRENEARRRARKFGNVVHPLTPEEWANIVTKYSNRCAYCNVSLASLPHRDRTMDHVIALANGGTHSADNVVPACRKCNLKKNARPLEEFLPTVRKIEVQNGIE